MTAGLNIDSWEGLSLVQHSQSCLCECCILCWHLKAVRGNRTTSRPFGLKASSGAAAKPPCGGVLARGGRIRYSGLSSPSAAAPPWDSFHSRRRCFSSPSALIPEATAAFGARTLFPSCGVPMKTPHITPTPLSGEAANVDVEP